ncbi:unnamed protein product [Heligmosomoides polygyrus]|uniref:Uncharacterized protein n=1 Tax=Heligmosomoides polygyrus TaxID=6339 RepID=A0A183GBI4_HELPZ|nr:unnamed protein product [Heligmosomoides polygyrus]
MCRSCAVLSESSQLAEDGRKTVSAAPPLSTSVVGDTSPHSPNWPSRDSGTTSSPRRRYIYILKTAEARRVDRTVQGSIPAPKPRYSARFSLTSKLPTFRIVAAQRFLAPRR